MVIEEPHCAADGEYGHPDVRTCVVGDPSVPPNGGPPPPEARGGEREWVNWFRRLHRGRVFRFSEFDRRVATGLIVVVTRKELVDVQ